MTIESCHLCPRHCGVRREDTARSAGHCRMPALPTLARAALHHGEEPCISGTNGSGTVFFSGCHLHCLFCQNASISQKYFGETVTVERLAAIFRELTEQGAHNINLVNPTPFVPAILAALQQYRPPVPIVYNSSGYESVETLRQLRGWVDIFLPDLKYEDELLALSLSGARDYPPVAHAAITEMARITGPVQFDQHGIMQKGTMVRHLVLPGHTRQSMAALRWLAEEAPPGLYVSLLFQYTPVGAHLSPPLDRRLTQRECDKMVDYALSLGIENGYMQERSSGKTCYIPVFDLTGVLPVSESNTFPEPPAPRF